MPNSPSAIKRMRSDEKKRLRNQDVASELKTLGRKLFTLGQDPKKAQELSAVLVSKYDRAVSRGVIPRGTADRKKSRIAHFLAKIKTEKKSS